MGEPSQRPSVEDHPLNEYSLEDTIAALATPRGRGAVALVRVCGASAIEVCLRLLPDGQMPPADRTHSLRTLYNPATGDPLDHALITVFRAPRSYTGEDTVEIASHGGDLIPQLILDALYAAGARPALPGEFTRRAYLNGRLDLLQAEAVVDLIDGRSPALHRAALHQMERGLSSRVEDLRSSLLRTEALIAYGIDFPDEDEPPVAPHLIRAAAVRLREGLETILRTAPQGELLRIGAMIVLAGYPNSGKSSLFNSLLGIDRSIVTEIAGTTRDAVEAETIIDGYPFRLVDTAGLRETEDRVEAVGVEIARRYLAASDIILFCSEGRLSLDAGELAFLEGVPAEKVVVARTKVDLLDGSLSSLSSGAFRSADISVLSGDGLDVLRHLLVEAAFGVISTEPSDSPLVTNKRHRRAVEAARDEVDQFLVAWDSGAPHEFAATHLQVAAERLQALVGAVTPDDVLGEIFSRFCVGK